MHQGHDLTLEKLAQLEKIAGELQEGKTSPDFWQKLEGLTGYFNTELEGHFKQEERVLFPVMEKIIGRAGFIHAMLDEHQSLWRAFETLEERIETDKRLRQNDRMLAIDLRPLEQVVTHIVTFLRSHITKEESSFFPLVEKSLDPLSVRETEQLLEQLAAVYS